MKKLPSFQEYLRTVEIIPQVNDGESYIIGSADLSTLASSLLMHMSDRGIKFESDNHPLVKFEKKSDSDNDKHPFFRRTGYYDPFINTITIFTEGRDIKDIIRSLAHEVIHADQYLNLGWDLSPAARGLNSETAEEAERIEGDAYLRGNIAMRSFEDSMRPNWQ
jgi:hypothetical protein